MDLKKVIKKIRENDTVLWIGAGFSLDAGMPSANTLRELIISSCTDEEKPYFENQSLSEVASTFIDLRNGSRNELHTILQEAIDIRPKTLKAHQLISEIPQIDLIVTTNYDKLFEKVYDRDISTIITDYQIPVATKRTQLYKIHGDINFPESIILTTDDYTDFFRNQNKPMWNKIKTLLAEKTIIFIGYSISDQNIDFLFENVINDLGKFQKESYLVAPKLPEHTLRKLAQKKISYINMTGVDFVEKVYEEIKKNMLIDIISNKIPKEIGLNILKEKHSLNAIIQTSSDGSSLRSIGSYDNNKKLNLDMAFQDIDFLQMLKQNQFKEFEISGEHIKSVSSHFEGISVPSSGKIHSLKVIPLPFKKFNTDLYFKGTDIILSDTVLEVYQDHHSSLFKFTHPFIELKLDYENKLFNFEINKISRLRDLEDTIQFLLALVLGEEQLTIYLKEDKKEMDFIQMSSDENIDIKNQLLMLENVVKTLKSIQKHYRIIFKDFHFNISSSTLEILEILKLHMNKNTRLLDKICVSTEKLTLNQDLINYDTFKNDFIIDQKTLRIHSRDPIDRISLFNQEIEINDTLNTICNDAYVVKSISQTNSSSSVEYFILELKSVKDGILQGFGIS